MKKIIASFMLTLVILMASLPTYAANNKILVDGIAVTSDVAPEIKNNRTMVPLRVISENLGVTVDWSNSVVTLTKHYMKVTVSTKSKTANIDGKPVSLDVKPYLKHNRVLVPLRFIAETFNSDIDYKNRIVTVNTTPIYVDGIKINAVQSEYHMTIGGVVQKMSGNANIEALYQLFETNKAKQIDEPADFAWNFNMVENGSYLKFRQYDFLDSYGNSIKQFDLYALVAAQGIKDAPNYLLYDANEEKWYIFDDKAIEAFWKLIDTASNNGYLSIVSDTTA